MIRSFAIKKTIRAWHFYSELPTGAAPYLLIAHPLWLGRQLISNHLRLLQHRLGGEQLHIRRITKLAQGALHYHFQLGSHALKGSGRKLFYASTGSTRTVLRSILVCVATIRPHSTVSLVAHPFGTPLCGAVRAARNSTLYLV